MYLRLEYAEYGNECCFFSFGLSETPFLINLVKTIVIFCLKWNQIPMLIAICWNQ